MKIKFLIFTTLSIILCIGCAQIPKYNGTFTGQVMTATLVDQKGQRFDAVALDIKNAKFYGGSPPNSVIATQPLIVNKKFECFQPNLMVGKEVTITGTFEAGWAVNPQNESIAVTALGSNSIHVTYVLKTRRSGILITN